MPSGASLGLVAVLVMAVGCSAPTESPSNTGGSSGGVTVTSCGQRMSFERPPERAVTLDQSSTETLLALGLADRMAGTSNLKTEVAREFRAGYQKVPVLSPELLTGEQLRAATPDLVVSSFADLYTRNQVGTREELRQLGLPSYVSAVDCPDAGGAGVSPFDLLFRDYQNLGRIFGVRERATKLVAEQRRVLNEAASIRRDLKGEPSVLWLYSTLNDLPYVAGRGGMPSEMSRLVGARNAFDDVAEDWPEVSWEDIAKRDPDVIVVGDLSKRGALGDSAREKIAMMRQDPAVSQLTAVRRNRIIQVPGIEMDPSVRTVHTLRRLMDGLRNLGYVR
ncbi:MAG: ABC transporter substrate-binding protein [Pseudonocardiaceae bacterium]|nr:ABC transporter substrate-binding protein [Pseudonocardiaceae bacterium]